jgi:hypothetical protein
MTQLKKEYDDLGKYLKERETRRPSRKLGKNEWHENAQVGGSVSR